MNTLRDARKSAGLSQQELASQAAVSRHSILRQEQYCYPTPLPNIIDTLAEVNSLGLSKRELVENYLIEVRAHRQETGKLISAGRGWVPMDYIQHDPRDHPFASWRVTLCTANDLPFSAIQFSALFSVHPAVLSRYESFKTRFPHTIEVALSQAGCPDDILATLRNHPHFNTITD